MATTARRSKKSGEAPSKAFVKSVTFAISRISHWNLSQPAIISPTLPSAAVLVDRKLEYAKPTIDQRGRMSATRRPRTFLQFTARSPWRMRRHIASTPSLPVGPTRGRPFKCWRVRLRIGTHWQPLGCSSVNIIKEMICRCPTTGSGMLSLMQWPWPSRTALVASGLLAQAL